jgi:hypothetical protein
MSPNKDVFFHFTNDKTLRDGSPIPPIGEWLIFPGKPVICQKGFHASQHPMDALKYAPGFKLHLVELMDIETEQEDKVVAKGRKIIATIDSKPVILSCARKFASDVLHLWDAPEVVKKYLKTGDPTLANVAAYVANAAAYAAAYAANATANAAANAANAAAYAANATAYAAAYAANAAAYAANATANAAKRKEIIVIQREYFLSQIMKEFNHVK